jgi:DNA-binding CsgD family transcriptional regulator
MEALVRSSEIVGRDEELHAIGSFLEQRTAPGALLIEGAAGIGKTTLWRWGVEHGAARGWHVLTGGPSASEARLAFAAVGDLLGGVVDAVVSRLPPPQQRALGVALLLEDVEGRPPDARAVGVAVLAALRELAGERSLLVAVDDVQWLDRPSADVLSFVARRLGDEPVALLFAQRTDEEGAVPLGLDRAFGERLRRVRPRPLSLGATHRLLRAQLGLTLTRPEVHRVHTACRGNPLFALEIGRMLQERPDVRATDEALPMPPDVERLVARRIERLSGSGREAVLAAALHGDPSAPVVEQAADRSGLEEAAAAGVLVVDGEGLQFAHPLFAEAAISLTPAGRRREMHVRLSGLLEDQEARAQHLALGTSEPAVEVAVALDRAAEAARTRGAIASAAALSEHAARLTPAADAEAAAQRTITAALRWTDAGDLRRSRTLVEPLLATLPAGSLRARALSAKARAVADFADYRVLIEEALAEPEIAPSLQVQLLFQLCHVLMHAVEFDPARERAQATVDLAQRTGDVDLIVLARSLAGRLHAGAAGSEVLRGTRDLERNLVRFDAYESSATWLGWWLLANDELDAARPLLVGQHSRAIDSGDEWSRTWLHWPLTELECRAGNYDAALAYAEEGGDLAEQSDNTYALWLSPYCRALVSAHTGDAATARAYAEDSLAMTRTLHSELFSIRPRIVLGFLAASNGDYTVAREHLEGLTEVALKGPYWATYPFWGDFFESLVALGDLERAQELLADIDTHRHVIERPGAAPVLARCRGLVLTAAGSTEEGSASFEEALRLQQGRPAPLERARTLLALGEAQRRARRRRAARDTLQQALAILEELGASLWAERATKEISRIGGRAPANDELTPSERRIAELVAEGKTNREVATILVVADRTVESALTQIYRKLDVRSRTELARKFTSA